VAKAIDIDGDRELVRHLLASAIIDQVNAGAVDRDQIAAAALAAIQSLCPFSDEPLTETGGP
jgi:hypothetical protein